MSQSLSRALQILIELGEGERSLDQLAASLQVHKTTAMRLLHALEAERFVRRDDPHRYQLGARLFALGASALQQRAIRDIAQHHLNRLSTETGGQAVHLAALENGTTLDDFAAMNETSEEAVGESRRTCSPHRLAIRDG